MHHKVYLLILHLVFMVQIITNITIIIAVIEIMTYTGYCILGVMWTTDLQNPSDEIKIPVVNISNLEQSYLLHLTAIEEKVIN